MKNLLFSFAFVALTTFLTAQPTWSEDVACIVYSHCSTCHNDVGIGPFNLMNYQDAFNNRYSMQASITDKSMPPWAPNQDYREMAHANVLSDEEIALFNDWVNGGAPEGDPMLAPNPPVIQTNEEITDPDVVFTTETFTVPSTNDDLYKCYVIQTNWTEDKYISELEIFPDNRNIVHHVLVYTNETNDPVVQDQNDPDVGYECGGSLEGGDNVLFGEWVPGSRARRLPAGTGIRIPAGANLVLQVHYPDDSDGQTDFIKLNMKFADGNNIREVYQDQTLDHIDDMVNGPLIILPFETKTFHEQYTLPEDRTFLATFPHAHLICTKMWSYAELPNGEIVNLVEIPNWDFEWQGFYSYPEPIILPAGTVLHGYARYQNDMDNPNQPFSSPQFITLGEDTTDEMMLFFFSYLFYEPGDENIVTGGGGHLPHHENCESVTIDNEDLFEEHGLSIYPNPLDNDELNIEWKNYQMDDYSFELLDVSGKSIFTQKCDSDCRINISNSISNGVYIAKVQLADGNTHLERILILR